MTKLIKLPNEEQKLLRQLRRGKSAAQKVVYQQHAAAMLGLCMRYASCREDAEEILSNGFIKVFEKIDQYKGDGPLGAWIRTIMVREALNFIRYRKNIFVEVEEERTVEMAHSEELERLEAGYLLRLIEDLPTGYRTVFNLFAIEGYAHKEIAEMLGISENTSKTQVRKARQKLQEQLRADQKQMRVK